MVCVAAALCPPMAQNEWTSSLTENESGCFYYGVCPSLRALLHKRAFSFTVLKRNLECCSKIKAR